MSSAILYSERAETSPVLRQQIGYYSKSASDDIDFCHAVQTP